MKFDFKSAFKAAKVPAMAMIALSIIVAALGFFGLNGLGLAIFSFSIQFAILAYAGYNGVKAFKLDFANGALAGAIASFLSMVATVALNFTFIVTGVIPVQSFSAQVGISTETYMIFALIGYGIGLACSPIIGGIFGAIGAYFAQKK